MIEMHTAGRSLRVISQECYLSASAQLNESAGRRAVRRKGILLRWACKCLRRVAFDVDDVCGTSVIRNECEFLLDTGVEEERRSFTMCVREGGAIKLGSGLHERDYRPNLDAEKMTCEGKDLTMNNKDFCISWS